jgi:undecaprenyl diphosphate synthase
MENNVRLHVIGHMEDLPDAPREALQEGINILKNNTGLNLVLALNYGARAEILDAMLSVCNDIEKGKIKIDELNEISFPQYLYTSDMPDPDMIIRTSGEYRISNFLLWQIAYSEIYFTPVFWPAFRRCELYEAIMDYQNRERRFGKVNLKKSETEK